MRLKYFGRDMVLLDAGHPGLHRTLVLLQQCFWWPSMAADVREYACSVRSKSSHCPPVGYPSSADHFHLQEMILSSHHGPHFKDSLVSSLAEALDVTLALMTMSLNGVFAGLGRCLPGIEVTASLPLGYHPQINGQMEQPNQDFGLALSSMVHSCQTTCFLVLPPALG